MVRKELQKIWSNRVLEQKAFLSNRACFAEYWKQMGSFRFLIKTFKQSKSCLGSRDKSEGDFTSLIHGKDRDLIEAPVQVNKCTDV